MLRFNAWTAWPKHLDLKLVSFRAIMSMDARDNFPVDMVEQMLKFTPTPEERALLDEHADEMEHLARADRFLFELSKITHYEQVDIVFRCC